MRKRGMRYGAALLIGIAVIVIVGVIAMRQTDSGIADEKYNGHGGTFKNPLIDMDTPDPSVVYKDGYYYMTFTHNGTDVMVMKSRTIDFKQAEKKVVWYPPIDTMYSANLWAPEIQYIRGKWYIYFAADDGQNENHRMYALEAVGEDPLGEYEFKGQITDETNKWAIDGLVMEYEGQLYFVWSGWEGDVNIRQNTYIAPMSDPVTISGPRVLLSSPDQEWEMAGGPPYIQEGQAILYREDRVFIVYSGAGSWTPFYSLGLLALKEGGNPLQPEDWQRSPEPLMTLDEAAGVYGPGHNSFVKSPDGTEDWIVYHATTSPTDGWNNRKARAQRITWNKQGLPEFGKPLSLDTAIPLPSGSGVYQAGHANRDGERLSFGKFVATVSTELPLLVHYKNETGVSRILEVWVDNSHAGSLELPVTAPDEIGYAYGRIRLEAGGGELTLKAGRDDAADNILVGVRAIELTRYEAETASSGLQDMVSVDLSASGEGVMKLTSEQGSSVSFRPVHVPEAGNYRLILGISNPGEEEQTVKFKINGSKGGELNVPATGRNIFTEVVFEGKLRRGDNEIMIEGASGNMSLDYMDIITD
ncbi:alpha-N-arabinofuranosidase [Paenibacillus lentus]|uniref:Alpha-N-arabinofuranosidase n=1 Tax=Paenibacillus lentus TaxID=1338368 RepID=A0A3S8S1D5_9BACL|nr:alpha-N-arabinofuranosidase [Paenibacillus lentus]